MGAFLDKPVTDKETAAGSAAGLTWGLASMQGWRVEMEDSHTAVGSVPGLPPGHSFFGVYDGHGGKTVSLLLGDGLVPCITQTGEFRDGDKSDPQQLALAVRRGLLDFDEQLKRDHPRLLTGEDRSGSTVVVALVTPSHYVIGNCGDSRIVLVGGGGAAGTVRFASTDHKPSSPDEAERIRNANGYVEIGRVCGNLAVSRSLGDFVYKDMDNLPAEQQKVSGEADMTVLERRPEDDTFLVLACDGIWDVMSNEQVAAFVVRNRIEGRNDVEISEALLDTCLELGSKDNMSAVVVTLPGAPAPDPSASPAPASPSAGTADAAMPGEMPLTDAEKKKVSKRLSVRLSDSERAALDDDTFEPK